MNVRLLGLLLLGFAWSQANATPVWTVIAAGDCRDSDLTNDMRDFTRLLQRRTGELVLTEDMVRDRLGPLPASSAQELNAQLQAAQSFFYDGEVSKAIRQIDSALVDVQKLSPKGNERWKIFANLWAYRALSTRHQNRIEETRRAFTEILRVNPTYNLDFNEFAPASRAIFARVREHLVQSPKQKLTVKSQPSGAMVYIQGFAAGRTPFEVELVPGPYQIQLMKDGFISLPHMVEMQTPHLVQVDLDFESSVSEDRVACLKPASDDPDGIVGALKLARVLNADNIVLLSLKREGAGPGWLRASAIRVITAQKTLEGGIKVALGANPPAGLEELATFVITGEKGKSVVPTNVTPIPAVGEAPVLASDKATHPQPVEHLDAVPHPWNMKRIAGWTAGGLGIAAAGAAVLFGLEAQSKWNQFNSAFSGPWPTSDQAKALQTVQNRARTYETLAYVSLGVSAAAIAGGTYLLLTGRNGDTHAEAGTTAGLVLTPQGSFATLSARW